MTILIVGAGLAGATVAERLTSRGRKVLVIDRRLHIAGNAYDEPTEWGLRHPYGPHIFHTNSARIVRYLSRFTRWRPYQHHVVAALGDKFVALPISPVTIEAVLGEPVLEAARWFAANRTGEQPSNAASAARARMGDRLFEALVRGYTEKMWGRPAEELEPWVTARLPIRMTRDDGYFDDRFQAMPREGFAAMASRMLARAEVRLGVDWREVRHENWEHVVFTGSPDEFFEWELGRLPFRSLRFEFLPVTRTWIPEPASTVNQPSVAVEWTRETDQRRLSGRGPGPTEIVREFPTDVGEPLYPMPTRAAAELGASYRALARRRADVTFAGRLGTYRYWNMDQAVANGLAASTKVP